MANRTLGALQTADEIGVATPAHCGSGDSCGLAKDRMHCANGLDGKDGFFRAKKIKQKTLL